MYARFLVAAAVLLSSYSAFALTKFEDLKSLFLTQAHANFQISQIEGWYSGRCYTYDRPDTPRSGVLVVWKTTDVDRHGPLWPVGDDEYSFAFISGEDRDRPTQYNNPDEQVIEYIQDFEDEMRANMIEKAEVIDSAFETKNEYDEMIFRARMYNEYIVTEQAFTYDYGAHIQAGETYQMCYFFKKLK
jgi:hypothetical protein